MKLLTLLFVALYTQAAIAWTPAPGDFPEDGEWAIAMTERACKIRIKGNVEGEIRKNDAGKGVIYTVFNMNGKVVASAWARNTSIFAKKKCLKK